MSLTFYYLTSAIKIYLKKKFTETALVCIKFLGMRKFPEISHPSVGYLFVVFCC